MGTEDRFKDPKKSKSIVSSNFPAPGHYPMIAQWNGKFKKYVII